MSNTRTSLLQQEALRDYTIQLTGGSDVTASEPSPAASTPAAVQNPPSWETEYREVPPYRPVNTQLDRASRPWGSNGVENVIIFAMFQGVWLKSSVAWLWRKTGGRFDSETFSTTIGGES
ncbi:hypothetical protein B0T16DRAFT_459200 [Cercophora newfieldiana]|uniref:Uncharacterized protein n=1 Tax=Cercophora newfieldiana TaxID=92897 RepID=A0AA39XZ80_9PEZI|nr:hypothetical protein B0T16DRAFT_459200 [Cercophora newfieldiana]